MTPELLTLRETADILRVSVMTVRRMINRGELNAVRIGSSLRIRRDVVDTLISGAA